MAYVLENDPEFSVVDQAITIKIGGPAILYGPRVFVDLPGPLRLPIFC
jgi:hypothetical protein